jgi:hypothetical protein
MSQSQPSIVGHCVKCGAPIYAEAVSGTSIPRSVYSCDCLKAGRTHTHGSSTGMRKYGATVAPARH